MKKLYIILIYLMLMASLLIFTEIRGEFGIEVEDREIDVGSRILSSVYSLPDGEHEVNSLPAVAVFHGFTATKEMMRPFTEGLAKAGFAVLTVDQQGHGSSEGLLGEDGDNSLRNDGVKVIEYLRSIEEVDPSRVAILGHSMGAGTAISTSVLLGDLKSTVLLGNSLTNIDDFNVSSTFPQNVFLGIGEYDELFDVDDAVDNFGSFVESQPEANLLYGDFDTGSARELAITPTDHIFEVLNPELVERSIEWVYRSLVNSDIELGDPELQSVNGMNYVIDQLLSLIAGLLIIGTAPLIFILRPKNNNDSDDEIKWLSHGMISFITFMISLPMAFLFSWSFAPLFLSWFILGSLSYFIKIKTNSKLSKSNTEELLSIFNNKSDLINALTILLSIMVLTHLILFFVHWDFRFVLPFLTSLSLKRIGLFFLLFIPGVFFFAFEIKALQGVREVSFRQFLKEILARIWMHSVLLSFHYIPIVFFQTSLLPSFIGFIAFFIVGLLPVMVILSVFSTFGRKYGWSSLAIAVISSGMVAWMLAGTLSFNA